MAQRKQDALKSKIQSIIENLNVSTHQQFIQLNKPDIYLLISKKLFPFLTYNIIRIQKEKSYPIQILHSLIELLQNDIINSKLPIEAQQIINGNIKHIQKFIALFYKFCKFYISQHSLDIKSLVQQKNDIQDFNQAKSYTVRGVLGQFSQQPLMFNSQNQYRQKIQLTNSYIKDKLENKKKQQSQTKDSIGIKEKLKQKKKQLQCKNKSIPKMQNINQAFSNYIDSRKIKYMEKMQYFVNSWQIKNELQFKKLVDNNQKQLKNINKKNKQAQKQIKNMKQFYNAAQKYQQKLIKKNSNYFKIQQTNNNFKKVLENNLKSNIKSQLYKNILHWKQEKRKFQQFVEDDGYLQSQIKNFYSLKKYK